MPESGDSSSRLDDGKETSPSTPALDTTTQLTQGSSTQGNNGGETMSSLLGMPHNVSPSPREDVPPHESEDVHNRKHGGDVGMVETEPPLASKRPKKAANAVSGGDGSGSPPSDDDAKDGSESGEKQEIESVPKKVRRIKPSIDHEAVLDVNKS